VAGPTACCGRTATGSGGMKASPVATLSAWVPKRCGRVRRRGSAASRGVRPTAVRIVMACSSVWKRSRRARIYQACVCTQFAGRLHGAAVEFFIEAVERTSPARAAYLAGEWGAVASLSPELFLRRRGEAVTSSPIKGTLPRHADPSALRASVKDVAENIMIVDLVRNDLGRVAITGTVTVPELLAVRPAPVCGIWCRRCRHASGSMYRWLRCSTRRSHPHRLPARPSSEPVSCCAAGSRIAAEYIAAQSG